jgi:hypothetical protein
MFQVVGSQFNQNQLTCFKWGMILSKPKDIQLETLLNFQPFFLYLPNISVMKNNTTNKPKF